MGRRNTVDVGSLRVIGAALSGLLLLTCCSGPEPAAPQPADVMEESVGATSTGHTIEQVELAVRAVDVGDSRLVVSAEPRPELDTWRERHHQHLVEDTDIDPAECARQFRDRTRFAQEHLRAPRVTAVGNQNRLTVSAVVFAGDQRAQEAARVAVDPLHELCREYTVRFRENGRVEHTRITPYSVDLPAGAGQVSAATVQTHVRNVAYPQVARRSTVSAVAGNVWISATHRIPPSPQDPEAFPVQDERATAERAVGQVLAHLSGVG